MGIVRTGKFIDRETTARLHQQAQWAARTPAMVVSQRRLGPLGKDEATLAKERFDVSLNECAVAAGCAPPGKDADGDIINYGIDFATGEVLAWDGQTEGNEGALIPASEARK